MGRLGLVRNWECRSSRKAQFFFDVIHDACLVGKTKLVQAVCKAASCTLLSVTNSDLLSRWFGECGSSVNFADHPSTLWRYCQKWIFLSGESEKRIKRLFEQAKTCTPCVIFFDEIDRQDILLGLFSFNWTLCYNHDCRSSLLIHSLGGSREKTEDSSTKKVLTELLVQISSIHPQEQVTVVGATNRL